MLFKNKTEENFYLNCRDCIYYGYGFIYAVDTGVESEERRKEIWNYAWGKMASEF